MNDLLCEVTGGHRFMTMVLITIESNTGSLRMASATAVPRCVNHPENQFLLFAFGPGLYTACSASGACGEVQVQ
jgi:hypothetical protein